MSTYDTTLGAVFPNLIEVDEGTARDIALWLNGSDKQTRNGSSFAITADGRPGMRKVWLSNVSHARLVKAYTGPLLPWQSDDDGETETRGAF